jgi:hypothetical protein
MAYMHPALAEHLRKRWVRPDACRFAAPGTPEAKPPGDLHPWAEVARQEQAAADEARARAVAEQDAFEREVLRLRHDFAKIRLDYELRRFQQKYSPDQPRVPAGNRDGGEWTSGGGEGAGRDSGAASQDGQSLAQDRLPLTAASDQPPRSDRPQLEAIANDPVIRAHIDAAWAASNPFGLFPKEHGFWISRNEVSDELLTRPFANPGAEDTIVPGPMPRDAIAFFHTHPHGWIAVGVAGPSFGDEVFAARVGLPGLIQSHVGMYYFGPPLRSSR